MTSSISLTPIVFLFLFSANIIWAAPASSITSIALSGSFLSPIYLFDNSTIERPAIKFQNESTNLIEISWKELKAKTIVIQNFLIKNGVVKGDRVVAYCSNTPEVIAAFLATNALGAIWSSCSIDFGIESVAERFTQINPKVLFVTKKYIFKKL